jgi:glycosyltransferase involved in cell wall biosynthesis
MRKPLLWLNPHYAVHVAGRMNEAGVVYDITDDWISMTQSPGLARRTQQQDAALCQKADAVIVCSERLFQMKHALAGDRLHLVPNGVDAEHYAKVGTPVCDAEELPESARNWTRPVLGYTGTVHPDRVDIDLVERVAQEWKKGSIVLLGPNHLSLADRSRLAKNNKVILHDAVPYAKVPAYMRAFDVCIVPHRMTAFTESLNPIKLWEYLAAGKPIVSTDVAGFRDFPRLVRLAGTADAFVAAAHAAVAEVGTAQGKILGDERQAVARQNSWKARIDQIEDVLDRVVARSSPQEGSVEVSVG